MYGTTFPNNGYYQPFNYQPQLSQMQRPSVPGRIVDNFSQITANDVPMDGSASFFATPNLSEVQVRAWKPDGTITVRNFIEKPIEEVKTVNVSSEKFSSEIDGKISRLLCDFDQRLDRLEELMQTRMQNRPKKEENNESK